MIAYGQVGGVKHFTKQREYVPPRRPPEDPKPNYSGPMRPCLVDGVWHETMASAARTCRVSPSTVRRCIENGRLCNGHEVKWA